MGKRGRPPHPDVLTPREREVLALIRDALSNEDIAGRRGISVDGVKYHVSQILSKLGVSSRQEAAAWDGEQRPWWQRALAPMAWVWRRTSSLAMQQTWIATALFVVLLLTSIGAFTTLGVLLWRTHGRSKASIIETGKVTLSTTQLATPVPTGVPTPGVSWADYWQLDSNTVYLSGNYCPPEATNALVCESILQESTDGGNSWSLLNRGNQLLGVKFSDIQNGWAAVQPANVQCSNTPSCPSMLYATRDGGASWRAIYSAPDTEGLAGFDGTATDAWIVLAPRDGCRRGSCSYLFLRTTDHGQSWKESMLPTALSAQGITLFRACRVTDGS